VFSGGSGDAKKAAVKRKMCFSPSECDLGQFGGKKSFTELAPSPSKRCKDFPVTMEPNGLAFESFPAAPNPEIYPDSKPGFSMAPMSEKSGKVITDGKIINKKN
jgi:hypothetical protein